MVLTFFFFFFKFNPKLTEKGFRVLAPDFPVYGKTCGHETGCHVFGFSINYHLYKEN